MVPYSNMHLALEQMRVLANRAARGSPPPPPHHESDPRPPRVLIIGPENSGKTSACKILINYAVRSPGKWTPMLVNLDTNDVSYRQALPGASLILLTRVVILFPEPFLQPPSAHLFLLRLQQARSGPRPLPLQQHYLLQLLCLSSTGLASHSQRKARFCWNGVC
jgi:mRNA cleavage and polyadenylation factor CLP1 P-loop